MGGKTFIQRLQSVRGLAALSVAGQHSLMVFHPMGNMRRVVSAFSNVFYGTGGVVIFFVLSGFVLGLTLTKPRVYNWRACREFLLRRFLRLFPALFFSLLAYQVYYLLVVPHPSPLSEWTYRHEVSWVEFLKNVLLCSISLNHATWSLQVEGLFSLLLPFLYFATRKSWVANLAVLIGLMLIYRFLGWKTLGGDEYSVPWIYLYVCYSGWLLSVFRNEISAVYRRLPHGVLYLLIAASLGVCLSTPHFGGHLVPFTIGAIFLVGAIAYHVVPWVFRVLDSHALIYLGNISYSFYLFHPLCLLAVIEFTFRHFSPEALSAHQGMVTLTIGLISVCLAVPVAWLSYFLCERPFTSRASLIPSKVADLKPTPIRVEIPRLS